MTMLLPEIGNTWGRGIVMVDRGFSLGRSRQGGLVETLFENRFDTFIGTGADREGPATGGFEPLGAVTLAQAHNAQA